MIVDIFRWSCCATFRRKAMMLVIPALVVSAFVWLAMAAMLSWLVWKLWVAHKRAESALESANVSGVE